MQIKNLFLTDVERDINPVIKVADNSTAELRNELEDYVVTDVIEKYLLDFLEHYTDTRRKETDRIGVWISGYVGAGKSHFSKILSLLTANPDIDERTAIDRFLPRLATCRQARNLQGLLHQVANFLQTEVIAFQINSVTLKGQHDDVCSILYRQFLAHRGLSTDVKLALTIEEPLLERGAYQTFRNAVHEVTGKAWEDVRERPMLYWDDIFDALARALPDRFKSGAAAQEAYDRAQVRPTFDGLARELTAYVERQQMQRRDADTRLLFLIDELGQFVADSGPRLLDVQSFAEEVATRGKGKVWIVVTSHESMQDVVKNAREFKGDIKKLEGRFAKRYTLTTENIERVLEERLFKKSKVGEDAVRALYTRHGGAVKDVGELVKVDRPLPACDEQRFVACYPFLPYQLILIPDALHGLRVAGGRGEALTGAARSLLGITQGILKHGYATAELGRLVALDDVYTEIEDAEIASDVRREISSADQHMRHDGVAAGRILRALYLLQQVPYAPRTIDNLVRLLASSVDADLPALREHVRSGLDALIAASYVARSGEQYEYLSGERKRIEEEIAQEEVRTAHKRDKLKEFFTASTLEVGTVRYEDAARFDVKVVCDDHAVVARGGIDVRMISPFKAHVDGVSLEDLEAESIATPTTLYWLAQPSGKIETLLDRVIRLERVITRYESDPSASKELTDVVREKRRELDERLKPELVNELKAGFRQGHFVFLGSAHAADGRIDRLGRLFQAEVSAVIPRIYTQHKKARHQVADERKALEAILSGPANRLSQIEPPLALFDKQGGLNRTSAVLDEVTSYLENEGRRGNPVTGKTLGDRYEGIPYGWDANIPRLCVAALFRAGALIITVEKRDYQDAGNADAQKAFTDSRRFDRAELRLQSDLELTVEERMRAREQLHLLFGTKPDETPAALAEALRTRLQAHRAKVRELDPWVRLMKFPTPPALATAEESFRRLVEESRPNSGIRDFLDRLDEVVAQVRAVDHLDAFYTSDRRQAFEAAQPLLAQLRTAIHEGLATDRMVTAVREYEGRAAAREVIEHWGELHGLLQQALGDLRGRYTELHRKADEAFRTVATRVAQEHTLAGSVSEVERRICGDLTPLVPEHDYRCNRCQRDLATLINAPAEAQRLEARLARTAPQEHERATPSNGPAVPAVAVQTVRVSAVPGSRIRKWSDWEVQRTRLDDEVRRALDHGAEVELT